MTVAKTVEMLVDLVDDPGGMNSLAGRKNYQRQLSKHRELLAKWMKETGDPMAGISIKPEI